MNIKTIGKWSFFAGIIVAIIAALIPGYVTVIALVLFLLGLLVGFLNITNKDSTKFLLAVVALVVLGIGSISALSVLGPVSPYLNKILGNFIAFVGAAGLVTAIKAVIESSRIK